MVDCSIKCLIHQERYHSLSPPGGVAQHGTLSVTHWIHPIFDVVLDPQSP